MCIQVNVKGFKREDKIVDVCDNEEQMKMITVLHLKKKLVQHLAIPEDTNFRMVFKAATLEDSSLLSSNGIRHMSTIHMLLILPGGL